MREGASERERETETATETETACAWPSTASQCQDRTCACGRGRRARRASRTHTTRTDRGPGSPAEAGGRSPRSEPPPESLRRDSATPLGRLGPDEPEGGSGSAPSASGNNQALETGRGSLRAETEMETVSDRSGCRARMPPHGMGTENRRREGGPLGGGRAPPAQVHGGRLGGGARPRPASLPTSRGPPLTPVCQGAYHCRNPACLPACLSAWAGGGRDRLAGDAGGGGNA